MYLESLLIFVEPYYENKDIMHNMWHIELVIKGIDKLIELCHYQLDYESLIYAAYFHGFIYSDEEAIREWLLSHEVEHEKIKKIITIAWESQRNEAPETLEGKILHDAHILEGGKNYTIIRPLITGSIRGQSILETIKYIEEHVFDQYKCCLPATVPLCEEANEFVKKFIEELKNGIL